MAKPRKLKARAANRTCPSCSGKGQFMDTTYVRTGEMVECGSCYGTGMTHYEIRRKLKPWRVVKTAA